MVSLALWTVTTSIARHAIEGITPYTAGAPSGR